MQFIEIEAQRLRVEPVKRFTQSLPELINVRIVGRNDFADGVSAQLFQEVVGIAPGDPEKTEPLSQWPPARNCLSPARVDFVIVRFEHAACLK